MIRGRVEADGTRAVRALTTQPRAVRGLLHLSIALSIGGTLSAGLLHVSEVASVAHPAPKATDVSFLAAETSPADLADIDPVVRIENAVPVGAVVGTVPQVKVAPKLPVAKVPALLQSPPTTIAPVPSSIAVAPTHQVEPQPDVRAVIREVFGPNGEAAIRVATCESHLNPKAISRGGSNWGLFQINKVHAKRVARMGYRWEDLLDARVNALVAKSIFDESGWGPWACHP